MKKNLWLKIILTCAAVILLLLAALVIWLTATEYRPQDRQAAEFAELQSDKASPVGNSITVYSWNIGYAGLGSSADFFMDGGSGVNPTSDEVRKNLAAVCDFISDNTADAWLLQEVDVSSARTNYTNELSAIAATHGGSYALAYNYKCGFVPFPLPPIGKIASGIATLADGRINGTPERIALPCPFSWPVSTANLKRCLLVTRLAISGSDRELVLVNLHLEAYDDGEGKIAQTKLLMEILQSEYEKGNYVIAGGDFNQAFPGTRDLYPIKSNAWTPGTLDDNDLPTGFCYAFDAECATCRLLDAPLGDDTQLYVLDGFIVSPNVVIEFVETIDLGFENSDHNPVRLSATLLRDQT